MSNPRFTFLSFPRNNSVLNFECIQSKFLDLHTALSDTNWFCGIVLNKVCYIVVLTSMRYLERKRPVFFW
jgi:hypothetical protein